MKLSCSSALLAGAGAHTLEEMVATAATLGVAGIFLDLPASNIDPAGFSFRGSAPLVCVAQAHAIEWQCLRGAPLTPGQSGQQDETLQRLICIAHALACPLVALTAPAHDRGQEFDAAYEAFVAVVQEALDVAQDMDICLAIEPAADTMVRTADHAVDFVDDVARRNLGIIYNPGDPACSGSDEPQQVVSLLKDYLLMVRLQGADLLAIQRNEFDHAIRLVQRAGFHEYYADCSPCAPADVPPYILEQLNANVRHLRGLIV